MYICKYVDPSPCQGHWWAFGSCCPLFEEKNSHGNIRLGAFFDLFVWLDVCSLSYEVKHTSSLHVYDLCAHVCTGRSEKSEYTSDPFETLQFSSTPSKLCTIKKLLPHIEIRVHVYACACEHIGCSDLFVVFSFNQPGRPIFTFIESFV